jgi:uncharacterized protein YggE
LSLVVFVFTNTKILRADETRSQADTIAGASGLQISGVRSVSTADSGVSPVQFEGRAYATEDASGGARTSVSSGPVSVNAQVNVNYVIG